MRKIEQELLNAIESKTNWSKDNSQVSFDNDKCYVYLHGNNIAIIKYSLNTINNITLYTRGYDTNTTKSRLNTVLRLINYQVYQEKYIWYLRCFNNDSIKEFYDGINIKEEFNV